ncbi:DUF211 domain-containing protein [Nitrosomonas marina]|uniref:ACT domain-containing protein n=1 Tax=Nitrosomonas marina TaxID=917 RepID=A0A1H8A8X9_9PROT|nr:DUF211 domain-containing protein [Nitrosomonas marina]SEM67013.1 hypothetical protein SAMN05216325_10116 [Nitrosomonas marina]
MVRVKHLILDVLKPHQPNGLAFASALAERCSNCHIKYTVVEVDEKTESIILSIAGENIRFEIIEEAINTMGASIHSIDEVEVIGSDPVA